MPFPNHHLPENHPRRGRVMREDYEIAAKDLGLKLLERPVQVGDLYLAGRNVGVNLFTAKEIHPDGYVISTTTHYPYDRNECIPVEEL